MTTGGNVKHKHRRPPVLDAGPVSSSPVLGCIKVPFETEADARVANRRQYPYRCPFCRKWHTTRRASWRRGRS